MVHPLDRRPRPARGSVLVFTIQRWNPRGTRLASTDPWFGPGGPETAERAMALWRAQTVFGLATLGLAAGVTAAGAWGGIPVGPLAAPLALVLAGPRSRASGCGGEGDIARATVRALPRSCGD
jgi:hypothetical protein